jgi:quinol monooxygenase YgiN
VSWLHILNACTHAQRIDLHRLTRVWLLYQVCCSKTLVAKPEHKEAVQQLCKEVTEFSTARMKERSNGIQEFNCMVDGWQDNVVHFWERYDSNVMLGRHNTTPEVETFMNKVGVVAAPG